MLIFFGSSKLWPWINSRHCFSHFLPSLKIESGYSGWWLYGTLAWAECYTRAAASNQGPATLLSNGVAKSSFVDQMSSWRIIIRSNWKILLCCFCHVHFDEDIYIHCIGNIPITKRCWQLIFFLRKELLRSQCPTSSCQCRMAMLVYTFNWLPIILTFRYQNLQHKHWFPSRSQFPIQTFVQ